MTSHPTSAITACLALQHAIRSVTGRTRQAPWVPAFTAGRPADAGFSAPVTGAAGRVLSCIKEPSGKTGAHLLSEEVGGQSSLESTAELAGLTTVPAGLKIDPDLAEWDYGGYEGRTTAEIRRERTGWYLWRDGVIPGDAEHPGETVAQVAARADAVLARVRPLLARGNVALVAHGHLLRILTARWLGLEPQHGRLVQLDTGTLSILGTEHGLPVIAALNLPASG